MNNYQIKLRPIALLYLSFVLFIVMTFTNNPATALNIYAINLAFIFILLTYLFVLDGKQLKLNLALTASALICLMYVVTMPVFGTHIYTLLFFLKIIVLIVFFRRVNILQHEILNFTNASYIIYLLLSILFWIVMPENASNSRLQNEEFTVHLFGFSYQVLPGIKGSPSQIDSYSAVILIINLTIKATQRYRKIVILFALLGLLLSFRLTPMVGLLLIFVLKPWLDKRNYFLFFNFFGFLAFILLILFLSNQPNFMLFGLISLSDLAYLGTHARSQIWVMQTDIMLNTYDIYQYIFGGYRVDKFTVPLMQFLGGETGRFAANPHNNYLMLFFRSPVIFIYSLIVFYWCSFKYLSAQYYLLFSFILLACYTNSSLISLENPVYIYLFIYFLLSGKKTKKTIILRSDN
jgi:hypothetical protein